MSLDSEVVANMIQSLGIIVAFGLAIWQMRVQTKHVRAANELALIAKFDEVNRIWLDNPGLADRLKREYARDTKDKDMKRLETTVYIALNTFELVHRHHTRYRLIADDWENWSLIIKLWADEPYVRGWWRANGREYGEQFRKLMDGFVPKEKEGFAANNASA